MERTTNDSRAVVTPYKTDAYGGSDADISNSVIYTHASGSSIDLLSSPSGSLPLGGGLSALITIKLAETTGLGSTDNLLCLLLRRHDNLWTGNEESVKTIYNAIPGVGTTVEVSFVLGANTTNISGIGANSSGPGHFRIGMLSSGATDDFDVEISVVVSSLISQQAWPA